MGKRTTKHASILLTILPLLILIPAFILAAYSSKSKDWTWRQRFQKTTGAYLGTVHRGPFVSCQLPSQPNATDDCFWSMSPGGKCVPNNTSRGDSDFFCRQLTLGGQLLYAGDTLLGVSLFFVFILTFSTLPQVVRSIAGTYRPALFSYGYDPVEQHGYHISRRRHAQGSVIRKANLTGMSVVTLLSSVLAALGGLALLTGVFITTNVLINLQYPSGDWYTTGNSDNLDIVDQNQAGPWLIGKAVGIASAAAVLSLLGAWAIGLVWQSPNVGVSHDFPTEQSEEHHAGNGAVK